MRCSWCRLLFFFFQAEDGIRDVAVTGVQTCALPILLRGVAGRQARAALADTGGEAPRALRGLVGRRRREVVLLVLGLLHGPDRESVVEGKSGDLGGRRIIKKKKEESHGHSQRRSDEQ